MKPELLLSELEDARVGIAVWDADRTLAYANRAFRNDFQIARDQIGTLTYDQHLISLSASGEFVLAVPPSAWAAEQLAFFGRERRLEQPMSDGRTLDILQEATRSGGMSVTVHDVTDRKRAEYALRAMREKAEETSETKSRFLRAANHDLRQPLATLRILIYNCMTEPEEEHRKDLFYAMDISVSVMEDLLSSLLQIGQLDAGQIVPRITTFQLSPIFERLEIQFAHVAAEKGLQLRFIKTRAAVVSDKALLERILANFVANAIRYTDLGRIVVGCRRDGRSLRIDVCDTGRGIAPEHHSKIFEEFYQVSGQRRGKRTGLGLGLNIVKRLAGILNHRVAVNSRPSRGSTFGVTVPMGDVWQSDLGEPEISEMLGGEFSGTPILLIEDDEVLRAAMMEMLQRWGVCVTAVTSGEEALGHVVKAETPPRMIIADYSLRGQLGTDVIQNLRSAVKKMIPAVIVTADVDPQVIGRIRSAGLPVLIKPVSPPRLRVTMHNLLFEPGPLLS